MHYHYAASMIIRVVTNTRNHLVQIDSTVKKGHKHSFDPVPFQHADGIHPNRMPSRPRRSAARRRPWEVSSAAGSKSAPTPAQKPRLTLCFPGGGTYFWWQLGAALKLQELYSLDAVTLCGASAGALAAVLTRCEVRPAIAHSVAHELALAAGVFDTRFGLYGKWGRLVYTWLDRLLPPDAAERCSGTVTVKVTVLSPWPRISSIRQFESREQLISALMASTHIPWFMDGSAMHRAKGPSRDSRSMDGALLVFLGLVSEEQALEEPESRSFCIRQKDDKHFMDAVARNGWGPVNVHGTDDFVRFGAAWAETEAASGEEGSFAFLEDCRRTKARRSTDALLRIDKSTAKTLVGKTFVGKTPVGKTSVGKASVGSPSTRSIGTRIRDSRLRPFRL